MKICFPVAQNQGLESRILEHFGSAPMFLIVETEGRVVSEVINRNMHHRKGACRPLMALGGQAVDAVAEAPADEPAEKTTEKAERPAAREEAPRRTEAPKRDERSNRNGGRDRGRDRDDDHRVVGLGDHVPAFMLRAVKLPKKTKDSEDELEIESEDA